MGGVAVLHPQDLLISASMKSRRHPHPHPTPAPNPTPAPAPSTVTRSSNRRKRSPQKCTTLPLKENNHHHNSSPSSKPTGNSPVLAGPVKILKRGEALPVSMAPSSLDLTLKEPPPVMKSPAYTTTNKKKMGAGVPRELAVLGPSEPDLKQIRRISDCYAGSAFISSPPPSSLPVPAFFRKKNLVLRDGNITTADSNSGDATSDLLRLLRLDLS